MKIISLFNIIVGISFIYSGNTGHNSNSQRTYGFMRQKEKIDLIRRLTSETTIASAATNNQLLKRHFQNQMIFADSSHLSQRNSIHIMPNSHIPDQGDFTFETLDLHQLQKLLRRLTSNTNIAQKDIKNQSSDEIGVNKRHVNNPHQKTYDDSVINDQKTPDSVQNLCNKNVSQSITEIMRCSADNIDDIRLPAMRNIRFNGIVLQMYNGWIEGVWNFDRNSSKLETVSCNNGLQTVTTTWKVYNPSIFTYWRRHENLTLNEDSSSDDSGMSCGATESVEGLAILKNSFVEVALTFTNPTNSMNSSVWISHSMVTEVGQYIYLVEQFKPTKNKSKNKMLKNWIQQIGLKLDFTAHVLRALLMGVNQCLPNSFEEDLKP